MSPKLIMTTKEYTPKIAFWLGFMVIIGLYFFLVRPIRVGIISALLDYIEPVLPTLQDVGIRNSATTLILSIGTQEVHSLKEFTYGLSFNSFFLFASLGLCALKNFKNSMQTLILIHLLGWIIATVFFSQVCIFTPTGGWVLT